MAGPSTSCLTSSGKESVRHFHFRVTSIIGAREMRFTRDETMSGIAHHGRLQAHEAESREGKGDLDGVKACRERASTAEAGFLLDRGDVERVIRTTRSTSRVA